MNLLKNVGVRKKFSQYSTPQMTGGSAGPLMEIKASFRAHEFQARLEGSVPPLHLRSAEIISRSEHAGHTEFRLKSRGQNANELVAELLHVGTILSFEERLPSLNEIFIEKVREE